MFIYMQMYKQPIYFGLCGCEIGVSFYIRHIREYSCLTDRLNLSIYDFLPERHCIRVKGAER
jgi:hypothetical protein